MKETIELEIAAKKTSWKELINSRGNRWRSFILIWCGEFIYPKPITATI